MTQLTSKKVRILAKRMRLSFQEVGDRREKRSEYQPSVSAMMRLMVLAIACGKRKLRQIETLSQEMDKRTRKRIGIAKEKKKV